MDEQLTKLINLREMVDEAVASSDLRPLFRQTGLSTSDILSQISKKLDDLFSIAAETVSTLQKKTAELDAAKALRSELFNDLYEKRPRIPSLLIWIAVFVIATGVGVGFYLNKIKLEHHQAWIAATGATAVIGMAGVVYWLRKQRVSEAAQMNLFGEHDFSAMEKEIADLRSQLRRLIYEKGIRPEVNGILSNATSPSYETRLGVFTATGLAEVFVSAHEVETRAKRELNELLKLPGGSIGLAGPRGAGKTTLMTLVANRPVREGKSPCSVLCPAPVEYPGRDFLVALFLLLCNWVLQDREPTSEAEFAFEANDKKPESLWAPAITGFLWRSAAGLFIAGLLLTLLGLYSAYQMIMPPNIGTSSATQGIGQNSAGSPPSQASTQQLDQRYLKALGFEPAKSIEWGLFFVAAAWLIAYFRPIVHVSLDPRFEVQPTSLANLIGLGRRAALKSGVVINASDSPPDPLTQFARTCRDGLRFQQSYTSGWSGSLKLPFGAEGGINDARTMSRNQRSLPELVAEFRDFLQTLSSEYGRVTICIDELDKLESDDKAHLFLNEIKAVFGVPNVFYLVSVSENAISAFERRGLPFRDVFDSSFDTIVHVTYLTLAESKNLLKRRTTRIPEPFLCFCHCLSGGLPRDLIRCCRDMLELSRENNLFDLEPLAASVISFETRNKARGMSIAASKVRSDAYQTSFLSELTALATSPIDAEALFVRASRFIASSADLRAQVPAISIAEEAGQQLALAELQVEFGLYLAYVGTLLELVAKYPTPKDWSAADNSLDATKTYPTPSIFDQLAAVRQAMAISPPVGQQRLITFRDANGFRPIKI